MAQFLRHSLCPSVHVQLQLLLTDDPLDAALPAAAAAASTSNVDSSACPLTACQQCALLALIWGRALLSAQSCLSVLQHESQAESDRHDSDAAAVAAVAQQLSTLSVKSSGPGDSPPEPGGTFGSFSSPGPDLSLSLLVDADLDALRRQFESARYPLQLCLGAEAWAPCLPYATAAPASSSSKRPLPPQRACCDGSRLDARRAWLHRRDAHSGQPP